MAQDVFVLTTDEKKFDSFKKMYPAAKHLPYKSLTVKSLEYAVSRCMTKFFYVVKPDALISNDFSFSYKPDEHTEQYVHMWSNRESIRLFNKRLVKQNVQEYTDTALKAGRIKLKVHNEDVIDHGSIFYFNEPDVFILCQVKKSAEKFVKRYIPGVKDRAKYIESQDGLTEAILNKIVNSSESPFFYVIDSRTKIKGGFDFNHNPTTKWDNHYVHVWNKCRGVRLFYLPEVEKNISNYTDKAWFNGKVSIKNHDEDYFELKETNNDDLNSASRRCEVFVITNDKQWYESFRTIPGYTRCHMFEGEDLTREIMEKILKITKTDFFYVVRKSSAVKHDYDFSFIPEHQWDLNYIHIWRNNPGVMLFYKGMIENNLDIFTKKGLNYKKAMFKNHQQQIFAEMQPWNIYSSHEEAKECRDKYYFILDDDCILVDEFDQSYLPTPWDEAKVHYWQRINPHTGTVYDYSGLSLHPNEIKSKGKQYIREPGCVAKPYDIVFLSYDESFANKNYERLQARAPWAKRVHGVKGIFEAHKEAARVADTNMFFVVDADAELLDNFEFSFMPRKADEHKVYVWRSQNPINDLVYGYGGVKLFPRNILLEADEYKVDFTTSVTRDFVPIAEISNVTRFNTDPFNTWKSAFRECVKLSSKLIDCQQDEDTEERLRVWCNEGEDRKFGKYAIDGANMGLEFGSKYGNDIDMLKKINDYDWLKDEFNKHYSQDKHCIV